ncbi:piggyBac transposable element-derived protein 4-like [Xyrichtys novacula]|uniref:PiggyBac transposable element-derived protein 4-like n=1 Tax=Xyrichtys novacula TaxID=13765 RepID=A0AAV1FV14_XYRNO|nr:piggyBac transposable element-derived protein 4-like [Xyrichtys novacula]
MAKKTFDTKKDFAEILAEIQRGSDVEFEDSSDSESGNDAGSEEEALFLSDLDPVNDQQEEESQEQAGPSGVFTPPTIPAAVTPPPPLPARVSPLETSEEEDEGKEYVPPQHRSSSSSGSWPSSPAPKRARGRGRGRGRQASKRPRPAPIHPEAQLERWHTKEEPDVEPPRPRFEPKNPPGPRIDTTVQWSPLSLFRLFFSSSTINTIINNTNANAARRLAQGAKYKWSPLSATPGPSGTNTCMPEFRGGDGTQQRRKCVVCAAKEREKAKQPDPSIGVVFEKRKCIHCAALRTTVTAVIVGLL